MNMPRRRVVLIKYPQITPVNRMSVLGQDDQIETYSANSHGAVNHVFFPLSIRRVSSELYISTCGSPSAGIGL
jgi:hypothetical protein